MSSKFFNVAESVHINTRVTIQYVGCDSDSFKTKSDDVALVDHSVQDLQTLLRLHQHAQKFSLLLTLKNFSLKP